MVKKKLNHFFFFVIATISNETCLVYTKFSQAVFPETPGFRKRSLGVPQKKKTVINKLMYK